MVINTDSVKTYLGITNNDYDERIETNIMIILSQISNYCNQDFVKTNWSNFPVYKACNMSFENDTITVNTGDISIFRVNDYIRIYNTELNNSMHRIENIDNNEIIVNSSLITESNVNAYIALVDFPNEFLKFVALKIKQDVIETNGEIKREKIADVEIEYFSKSSSNAFSAYDRSILNNYRKVYKSQFFKRLY